MVVHADPETTTNVAFADVSASHPFWLYSRSWNMLRLTGRGLDASGETFEVTILPDGFMIILK